MCERSAFDGVGELGFADAVDFAQEAQDLLGKAFLGLALFENDFHLEMQVQAFHIVDDSGRRMLE